ncbi:MAG TPA: phosphosulfolactate synthase [Chondromyces sp.]|nr:phosphosulfolactate synthase [Chondromyces sp.]
MRETGLTLPERQTKPRDSGITILIDNGVPYQFFKDTIDSAGQFVDFVKFGWGTSVISAFLEEKIDYLQQNGIQFFFGGTLFEKFASQQKVEEYRNYCKQYGCQYIEVSNGTLDMSNSEKARYISELSKEFTVFSEVGSKSGEESDDQHFSQWIEWIQEDLEAGAEKVITEARESGTSGLCHSNGNIRMDIISQIMKSGIDLNQVIFEAPNKALQTELIKLAGANVNLANISFTDPIPLETLRLGLRSDTFHFFN